MYENITKEYIDYHSFKYTGLEQNLDREDSPVSFRLNVANGVPKTPEQKMRDL